MELREAVTGKYIEATFFARIDSIHPANEKPLAVKRTFQGTEYTINCYVTRTVKEGLEAGKITVGNIVLVVFVDAKITQATVIAKVIATW